MKHLTTALIFLSSCGYATAGERSIIDEWYAALKASDRSAFEMLLAGNAVIELEAIGVTQNKREFLDALDHWEAIAEDLELSYEFEGVDATSATAEVCYRFPSNSFTNLETFTVYSGEVVKQVQTRMKDGC